MAFRRSDVVLIPFPYTDLSAAKTRPAVVVSRGAMPSPSHREGSLARARQTGYG